MYFPFFKFHSFILAFFMLFNIQVVSTEVIMPSTLNEDFENSLDLRISKKF